MPKVHFGTEDEPAFELAQSDDLIAVRTRSGRSITRGVGPVPSPLSAVLDDGTLVASYPEGGVEIYRVPVGRAVPSMTSRKAALRASADVRFAGGVLVDPATADPVLYTENLFIKFVDSADPDDCLAVLRESGLTLKNAVDYATNAYFVQAAEGFGQKVFDLAVSLLERDDVEYCHPELIRPRARKGIFPEQWHLKKTTVGGVVIDAHSNVEAAHQITRGEGVTIAIIDDGVDIDHPEFSGFGKVVSPRDATLRADDPRPKDLFGTGPELGENHGTACAGVACANGTRGASGVAPAARLLPIRLASGLGSQREAEAFKWAADNGADVISCSWGPEDGRWYDPRDRKHQSRFLLPASTRLAIDFVIANGRGGKGAVVLFAAGNGNEAVDNDGYASNPKVIAVAACNDRGTRSVYSDFGDAVWCAFPSSDFDYAPFDHPAPLTTGVWTTDRSGRHGYNEGAIADGDVGGDFTNSFGGTSSAAPGAAGVAALVLSVNPDLKWDEVKDLMRRACDKIDPQGADYDADGHSPKYGFGRLNARTAVELAKPQPRSGITINRVFDAPIPDLQTVSFSLDVPDDTPVETLEVSVDLKHTFVGDLLLTLRPPASTGVSAIELHRRTGGPAGSLTKTYDRTTTPKLASFRGKSCNGSWTLEVRDAAAEDSGTLVSFALGLSFAHAGAVNRAVRPAAPRPGKNRKSGKTRTTRTTKTTRKTA